MVAVVVPQVALVPLDQSPSPLIREAKALGKVVELLKFFVKNLRLTYEEYVGLWVLDGDRSINGSGNC